MSLTATQPDSRTAPTLPPTPRLGAVHLTVADVDRSVAWYRRALGLRVHRDEAAAAELGDGVETVVVLHEGPQAAPAGRHAGLYHYALLYPSRSALIELAADRPREQWPTPEEEFAGGGPRPLDFDDLLAAVSGQEAGEWVAEGLRMGHVHLHVGDVEQGLALWIREGGRS